MVDVLGRLPDITSLPQPAEGATYAAKIDKAEARIDWQQDAAAICRLVRAMQPAPGAWFLADSERVKLIDAEEAEGAPPAAAAAGTLLDGGRVAAGSGAVRLLRVQPAGRPAMAAADWWRGRRLGPGDRLQ
jgi:methionyl-tRNA formyltransferase